MGNAVKLRMYTLAVSIVAAGAMGWTLLDRPGIQLEIVVILGVLSLLADWLAFELPLGGSVSLGFVFQYAAVLLGGPLTGAVVALFLAVTPQDIKTHKAPSRMLFNAAQLVLAATLSGWLFLALGGVPLLEVGAGETDTMRWLLPALAAAPLQAIINMTLVAGAMSLVSGLSLRKIWALGFREYIVSLVALIILGLVLAQLVALGGYWALILLVVPFLVARQTFRVYKEHADAYKDTLRSLVTALEAKDTYTRGHSERVARFARGIAEELGLSESMVRDIEWAALLHDIGKIAISTATLRKPSSLTPEEYHQVQEHPQLASETLADIEFLEDILPMISAHHERMDGRGYPSGLAADQIDIGARILAVADSFDAMTSDRPYRQALDTQAAAQELVRSSGTQLDPRCVFAFLAWAEDQLGVQSVSLESQ